jgi:hypothetical protein
MNCAQARENLAAYLDGELGKEQRLLIEEHVAACRACREEARRLSDAWKLLGRHLDLGVGPGALARFKEKARQKQPLVVRRPSRFLVAAFAVAACLTIAVGVHIMRPKTVEPVNQPIATVISDTDHELVASLDELEAIEPLKEDEMDIVANLDELETLEGAGVTVSDGGDEADVREALQYIM